MTNELRKRAEEQLEATRADVSSMSEHEVQALVHELQVHQIELEMQNQDLREAQAALAETRDRYVELYEFAPVGYITLDKDHIVRKANCTFATLLGLDRSALLGRRVAELIAPEYRDLNFRHMRAVTHSKVEQSFEVEFNSSDGTRFWALVHCSPNGENGRWPGGCRGTITDISEQKAAEESAHRHAEQLEMALDAAQMATWSWDAANGKAYGDSRLQTMLGNPGSGTFTTERFFEYIHEEDRSRVRRNLESVLKTGKDFRDEFRIVRTDGVVRWVVSFGRAYHEGGHESACICGVNFDITERRRAEQAFREAERFSTALNRINETIHKQLDTDTIIRNVVDEGAETLGCESAALSTHEEGSWVVRRVVGLPESLVGLQIDGDEARHVALVARTAAPVAITDAFRDSRVNTEHMRKYNIRAVLTVPLIMRGEVSGVLFFNYHSGPREFSNLEILFVRQLASTAAIAMENARLVEERLETEEELAKSRDQLEERVQERTAQLRALAAQLTDAEDQERQRLAHLLHDDLQQQLAVLKMRLNGLVPPEKRDADTAKQMEKYKGQIDEAIKQTRTLSRELSPPALRLHGLQAALEWLAEEMSEKHGLEVRVDADSEAEPRSSAWASILFRATQELLYNVVKHSGQSFALVEVRRIDGHIQLRVRDEGDGFDPEAMRQKRESLDSFGLLSIEERLAFLGGGMEVTGTAGKGCCVTLSLPVEDDALYMPAGEEGVPESIDRKEGTGDLETLSLQNSRKISVLLADDHYVVRESLASLLADEEDIVVTAQASDGREAVQLARTIRPDVVLMDVSMPELNGIQAAGIIRAELPDVRIVGLSMHDDKDTKNRMLEAGADAFVAKGASPEELLDTIRPAADRLHE